MSDTQSRKPLVNAEAFLTAYVNYYNSNRENATIQEFALSLGMNPDNVYQRLLKLRATLVKHGTVLPLIKRSSDPRKTVKRVDPTKLASIARMIQPSQTVESSES